MAKQMRNAKRANRPNPREDRNVHYLNVPVINVEETTMQRKKVVLVPRNLSQEKYIAMLEDESKDIVFGMGPAGTGKSYLATLYAIKELRAGNIDKIIITRPLVANGENIGALPGDLMAKLAPWCTPILDIFKEFYSVQTVKKMLENETLELAALGLMRGRTIKNAIMIGDEMQNATPDQMKMFLTRIGDGSQLIVTGDIDQHDRGYEQNGLKDVIEKLALFNSNRISYVGFGRGDIERHPVVDEVLSLYS